MKKTNDPIFDKYIEILLKWQKTINIISPKTIPDLWNRHFENSLLLFDFLKNQDGKIFDIGSGGGFPGMVLSIAGIKNITFIESDRRKSLFLNEIKKAYNLDVDIINERVEKIKNISGDIIIGRAFATLDDFFELCKNIITPKTNFILLKGNKINEEIKIAKKSWDFDYKVNNQKDTFILEAWNIKTEKKCKIKRKNMLIT